MAGYEIKMHTFFYKEHRFSLVKSPFSIPPFITLEWIRPGHSLTCPLQFPVEFTAGHLFYSSYFETPMLRKLKMPRSLTPFSCVCIA